MDYKYCKVGAMFYIRIFTQLTIIILLLYSAVYAAEYTTEGIKWGRLKISPGLSISEIYTDNIFLEHENKRDEFITRVTPALNLIFALDQQNKLDFSFRSDHRFYSEFENLAKDTYNTAISYKWMPPRGSRLETGGSLLSDTYRPRSEEDRSKDYIMSRVFLDALYKLGEVTGLGFRYDYWSRRFKSSIDEDDDFDRHTAGVEVNYRIFPVTSLLVEYVFSYQDNKELEDIESKDANINTVFVGARWDPTAKLSGALKVGYTSSDFNDENLSDAAGYAMDTDLTYKFTDITSFRLTAFRDIRITTRSAREDGRYFINTGGGLSITYRRWEPLSISARLFYRNKDFQFQREDREDREDDFYSGDLRTTYRFKDWLSSSIGYRYRRNDSDIDSEEYRENLVDVRLTFSI